MLVTMKQILDRASKENYAVAAPNVYYEMDAKACLMAAEETNSPIILDVSFKARPEDMQDFGISLLNMARKSTVPVAINLDHGADKKQFVTAIRSGFTSLMADYSSLPIEENISKCKEVVEMAHSVGMSVEAELGHVGQAQNYTEDRDSALTKIEDAVRFIEETGIDCLAIAIGTAHGAYPKGYQPYLDFDRLVDIKKATNNFPLVLHGSSGTKEEDIKKACQLGINKVNIANDVCKAAVASVKNSDLEGQKAYDVYKTMIVGIKEKMIHMIELYGSKNKAWTAKTEGVGKQLGTAVEA